MIEPKKNIITLSLNIIKLFFDKRHFNHIIFNNLQFIDVNVDNVGFFSHFHVNDSFEDIVYSKIYGKDEQGNIILFNVFANKNEIEIEGVTVGNSTYIFDKNIELFIDD